MQGRPKAQAETVFIFDQDKTLYPPGELTDFVFSQGRKWFCAHGDPKVEEHEYQERVVRRYPKFSDGLRDHGLSLQRWHAEVQAKLLDVVPKLLTNDRLLARQLLELSGEKYVVSLSSQEFSSCILQSLGIAGCFDAIVHPADGDKRICYSEIQERCRASSQRILVVGDNYEADLEPAIQLGFRTAFLHHQGECPSGIDYTSHSIHELLNFLIERQRDEDGKH